MRLVGSGHPSEDLDLRIVDSETASPLPGGRVGEVWFRGPQVTRVTWESPNAIHDIMLVRPNEVPRTSSGKIQRSHCRQLYLQGKLEPAFQAARVSSE